jgi:hypothetical protein
VAVRATEFLATSSDANQLLKDWDTKMVDCQKEVDFDLVSNRRDRDNGSGGGAAGSTARMSDDPAAGNSSGARKRNFSLSTEVVPFKQSRTLSVRAEELDPDWKSRQGWAAHDYGIHLADTDGVIFGNLFWMKLREEKKMISLDKVCMGCIAPYFEKSAKGEIKGCTECSVYNGVQMSEANRYLWCTMDCADKEHKWPSGTQKSDWMKINIYAPKDATELSLCKQLLENKSTWKRWQPSVENTSDGICTRWSLSDKRSCMMFIVNVKAFHDVNELAIVQRGRDKESAGKGDGGKNGRGGRGKGSGRGRGKNAAKFQKAAGKGGKDNKKDFQRLR